MEDSETVALLRRQISAAEESGPAAQDFAQAINYYYGRARGDELPGRSQIQSLDVADMTHAVMAQILPTFVGDNVCAFEPDSPNDEQIARLETDATNKVMMESSRGFVVFYEALKDALLQKCGIVKAYLEEVEGNRYVRLTAVDPANFIVGAETDCILLQYARFVAERKEYSRGELLELGFTREKVEQIPSDGESDNQAANARRRQGISPVEAKAGWANERVTIWECYTHLPKAEDSGETRLTRCIIGGQELLLQEDADLIPYAAGTGFLEPHKFWGLSLYDRLKTVQDAKTAIMRQWLDNLANCNNSRTLVNESVNIDDYLTGRAGGAIRVKGVGPVGESALPLPIIDAGPAAQAYLAYMDQVRADRGGAALQMASAEAQLMGEQVGSMGVDRIMSVQESLAGLIARTFAETLFRSAFLLVHTLLRTELKEPMMLRMADRWVEVNTAQFRPRVRVNIKAGLSPGERARKAANLGLIFQQQMALLQGGMDGVLVSLPNLYNAFIDWAASQDIDGPEKYLTDPQSQLSQQAGQAKAQQGQQMQQAVAALEQAKVQIDQQKVELEKWKHETELQFKYWEARLDAETEEAKLVGSATASLELEGVRGRNQLAASREGGAKDAGRKGREAA